MQVLKYIGMGIGGLVLIGLIVLGVVVFFMSSASKAGRAKVEALEKEFAVGQSVDNLIGRAEAHGINSIWWDSENGREEFETRSGNSDQVLDFKLAKQKFDMVKSGKIQLLAQGSAPLQRYILSIEFVDRKVTKVDSRVVD